MSVSVSVSVSVYSRLESVAWHAPVFPRGPVVIEALPHPTACAVEFAVVQRKRFRVRALVDQALVTNLSTCACACVRVCVCACVCAH